MIKVQLKTKPEGRKLHRQLFINRWYQLYRESKGVYFVRIGKSIVQVDQDLFYQHWLFEKAHDGHDYLIPLKQVGLFDTINRRLEKAPDNPASKRDFEAKYSKYRIQYDDNDSRVDQAE